LAPNNSETFFVSDKGKNRFSAFVKDKSFLAKMPHFISAEY